MVLPFFNNSSQQSSTDVEEQGEELQYLRRGSLNTLHRDGLIIEDVTSGQ